MYNNPRCNLKNWTKQACRTHRDLHVGAIPVPWFSFWASKIVVPWLRDLDFHDIATIGTQPQITETSDIDCVWLRCMFHMNMLS